MLTRVNLMSTPSGAPAVLACCMYCPPLCTRPPSGVFIVICRLNHTLRSVIQDCHVVYLTDQSHKTLNPPCP
jgi:hypothetical protein